MFNITMGHEDANQNPYERSSVIINAGQSVAKGKFCKLWWEHKLIQLLYKIVRSSHKTLEIQIYI